MFSCFRWLFEVSVPLVWKIKGNFVHREKTWAHTILMVVKILYKDFEVLNQLKEFFLVNRDKIYNISSIHYSDFNLRFKFSRRKSWMTMVVLYPSILPARFAFEDTTSCWDTGKTRQRLTPALIPAVGSTPGKSVMKYCGEKTKTSSLEGFSYTFDGLKCSTHCTCCNWC